MRKAARPVSLLLYALRGRQVAPVMATTKVQRILAMQCALSTQAKPRVQQMLPEKVTQSVTQAPKKRSKMCEEPDCEVEACFSVDGDKVRALCSYHSDRLCT
jgi:hypothetical protein